MKLNEAIINVRVKLQNSKCKKSGKNKFANFNYYELSDFLPTLNELMNEVGMNDQFSISGSEAKLVLILGDEKQEYTMPFIMFDTPLSKNGQPSMQHIQYLGALNTYYKRYLYLNAFGITDGEVIDALDNSAPTRQMPAARISQEQVLTLQSLLTDDEAYKQFLAKSKLSRLEDMPIHWYEKAVASLKA